MAQSIKEIKKRITSTKKTGQITKAMYMVSQSKVKRSEKARVSYQSYLKSIKDLTKTAFSNAPEYQNDLLAERENKRIGYLLISSDTGLAGGYNNQVFKTFQEVSKGQECIVATIGRKAYNFVGANDIKTLNERAILIRDDVMFLDIVPISRLLIDAYQKEKVDSVYIIYNHYINTISTEVRVEKLLPLNEIEGETLTGDFLFEGGVEESLDNLVTMYIESILYSYVLDAKSSEHSSRMNAMKSASDNVDEIVAKFELIYNQARQQAITTELIDIISGSNAINQAEKEMAEESVKSGIYQKYEANESISFVTVYSAKELSASEEERIKEILVKYYQKENIRLIKKIDLSLSSGYYLLINNQRVDFNLDNMIENLKGSL